MGDDLGEEWWQEPGQLSGSSAESSENEETVKESSARKRKQRDMSAKPRKRKNDGQSDRRPGSAEKKRQPSKSHLPLPERKEENAKKTKKRKKKKKISEILANSAPKSGVPSDLQKLLLQHFENRRTAIEMEELTLPDACFLPSSDLTHTLSSYLKEISPKWTKLCKNHQTKKSLLLLLVCSSAHRALEVIKLLATFKGNGRVLKLFAKHIKINEQMKALEKGIVHLGVGTPGRVKALIEQEGLTLDSLKYLIFDWNWRDQKLRRMIEIPEVKRETMELLETGLIGACRAGTLKLGLF